MKQRGVSFLEIIVVVAILTIVGAFVSPSIMDWRGKRSLESDYAALVSSIDFLKTRVRTINGTGLLICNTSKKLSYQISSFPQSSTTSVAARYTSNIVENPLGKDANFNILSGETSVVSTICSAGRGIFTTNGLAGVEGAGGAIDIELNRNGDRAAYGAYRVLVNQTTSFVQKFKWQQSTGLWIEQD